MPENNTEGLGMNRFNGWSVSTIGGMILLAWILAPGTGQAQESVAIRAMLVKTVPDDPAAAAWSSAIPARFPLSPQVHWPTRILEVTAKDVTARGLSDGKQVAIMLEYEDPTEDPDDAAAIEFMVGDKKAHFAHGQAMAQVEGGPVNIWFWKNKDAKVLDMNAKGFGTLKVQDQQDIKGKGVYQNGKWKVVFSRAVTTGDANDTQFKPGEFINIAFAVWDGKKDPASGDLKEKGSEKAVSSWWYFRVEPQPDYSSYFYALLAIGLAAGFEFVVIRKLRKGPSA
jgi:DMSO reductase family type II enzyme heme b subunit